MKSFLRGNWQTLVATLVAFVVLLALYVALGESNSAKADEYTVETDGGTDWDMLAAVSEQYGAEERVVDLPKDSEKWFISVIGDPKNVQYKGILRKFDRDKNLKSLKAQVHFWAIPTTSPAYKARYEKNTKILPTIRVQESDGTIVWEAAARGIPVTANGLYVAIKNSSMKTMAIMPWRRNGTVIPWRGQMEQKCGPKGCPAPKPVPVPTPITPDPEPAPLLDGGPPEFEETEPSRWYVVMTALASSLAGGGYGLLKQWKKVTALE